MEFRILYRDDWLVAVDKPAGFQVHQPEDQQHRISRSFDCIFQLRRQLDRYVYPIHRLDRATSGVLLFALDAEAARRVCDQFQKHEVTKTYVCVTRGWTDEGGVTDRPLSDDNDPSIKREAKTTYQRLATVELPYAVGRYPTARYSLVRVVPQTGRMHQIRRHFGHLSHPLVGDTIYGDGQHNRFFRNDLKIRNLMLKAYMLELRHPFSGEALKIRSKWNPAWHKVFDLFGACPWG
jgi:tRNA pseudouridine65 synthase